MAECVIPPYMACTTCRLTSTCRYETSAAIIETETSTIELAQEVRDHATQARIAAKETALIAEVNLTPLFYGRRLVDALGFVQAQPHLPSGVLEAGDTTTAARAEAEQETPEAAQQVHQTAEHAKGVAEHAASTAHVRSRFCLRHQVRKSLSEQ